MGDALRRSIEESEDDADAVIDLWRAVTPMSPKQKRRLGTKPSKKDILSLSLRDQTKAIWERTARRGRLARVNVRIRRVKIDDGYSVKYQLGYGIRTASVTVFWRVFDELARQELQRGSDPTRVTVSVETRELDKKLTGGIRPC